MAGSVGGHDPGSHWEAVAEEWTEWARAPGHDAYWSYRDALREFLPTPGVATLDIGCGEGRVARDLAALGHRVTAVDIAPSLISAARATDSGHQHVLADATRLCFAAGSFDRVVSYNVLMDVPDLAGSLREAGRVLAAGGLLTMSIVHPFIDRGRFAGHDPDAPFVIDGSYFGSLHRTGREERNGRIMHFSWWSRPLESYVHALREAGFTIVDLCEPRPTAPPEAGSTSGQWNRLPLFLWINAVRAG